MGNSEERVKGDYGFCDQVRNFKELEQLGESVIKGKIVFFNFPMNPTYVRTFRAYGESGVYRTQGPSRAARYGGGGRDDPLPWPVTSTIIRIPEPRSTTIPFLKYRPWPSVPTMPNG